MLHTYLAINSLNFEFKKRNRRKFQPKNVNGKTLCLCTTIIRYKRNEYVSYRNVFIYKNFKARQYSGTPLFFWFFFLNTTH